MFPQILKITSIVALLGFCLSLNQDMYSQEVASTQQIEPGNLPPVPKGVEVMTRGPVHEAFATPTTEPRPTPLVPKKPPAPLEEMPPEEKLEGDVVWIGGYWAWDDDRQDFLWVSGCWRSRPPGKEWLAGYWRELGEQWQWVPGFWANVQAQAERPAEITYYPEPPATPAVAPPPSPAPDYIYIPGCWHWQTGRYFWRAGYWRQPRLGYVWVPAHYRWTPGGYLFISGYWDLAIHRRGLLYAPVVVNPAVVGPGFFFTPTYAICDTIIMDSLFVRPVCGCYYFGDYYGTAYARLGFESCFLYSRRCYDPIVAYQGWVHRSTPGWLNVQVKLCLARNSGQAPRPPRTLVQQNTIIQQNISNVTNNQQINSITQVAAPSRVVSRARGQKLVPVAASDRSQVLQTAQAARSVAVQQRQKTEAVAPAQKLVQPRVAAMTVPTTGPGPITTSPRTPGGTDRPVRIPSSTGSQETGTPGKTGPTTNPPRIKNEPKGPGGQGQVPGRGNTSSPAPKVIVTPGKPGLAAPPAKKDGPPRPSPRANNPPSGPQTAPAPPPRPPAAGSTSNPTQAPRVSPRPVSRPAPERRPGTVPRPQPKKMQ